MSFYKLDYQINVQQIAPEHHESLLLSNFGLQLKRTCCFAVVIVLKNNRISNSSRKPIKSGNFKLNVKKRKNTNIHNLKCI